MKFDREKIKFIILRTLGNFFLLFSLWGMAATFGPAFYLEVIYRINQARNIRYVVYFSQPTPAAPSVIAPTSIPTPIETAQNTFFGQLTGGNRIQPLSPVSAQFGIIIPKVAANAPIYPNVDPSDEKIYLPILEKGVAHAGGTVFPGVTGNIFLFAHSTDNFWNVGRYNAIFYLLKELENGDEVDLFFNGVRYVYRVVNKIVVDPSEVRYLTQTTPYEQLTLQTCWPPGTTLKRLIVLARPERDLIR
ncbi:sortase [Candidatus Gottesmanbacteria bacterium]|nr:sortase [Candidatus Gottesmanbacteria bacterium]